MTKPGSVAEAALPIQILDMAKTTVFHNPGKDSAQLLWSGNSPEAQVTITRVTMQPGAISERHIHATSEQTWIVEQGDGMLLLGNGKSVPIKAGDLVRTPPNNTHGIENTGKEIFIYTSITTPPENMAKFYKDTGNSPNGDPRGSGGAAARPGG